MKAETLRKSILQYAIQGKLVPQIDTEEPASELLKKIKAEKQDLIKQGKIKKSKPLPPITDDEKPFDIPESWEWVRICDCSILYTGDSINAQEKKKKYSDLRDGYNYIATKDVAFDSSIDYKNGIKIPFDTSFKIAKENSILMCIEGGSAGRKIGLLKEDVCFGNKLCCFESLQISCMYLFYYLQTHTFTENFKDNKSGMIGGVGINTLKTLFFALPPIQEQQRIVNHIEELMLLVDDYEKKEVDLEQLEKEFPEKLKKSILQYAIQGKLVEKNPNDESAKELLKKITAEKEELIKQGKIKKSKPLPPITDDEKPFDIPESWEWVRIEEISAKIHYGFNASASEEGNCRLLRITDIQNDKVNWDTVPFCTATEKEIKTYSLNNRDIMIARTGGTIGKTYITENLSQLSLFASYLIRVIPTLNVFEVYLKKYLESPFYWEQLKEKSAGTGQPNVNGTALKELVVPLPPFKEQQRIVARVEELFKLVDMISSGKRLKVEFVEPSSPVTPSVIEFQPKQEINKRVDVASFDLVAREDGEITQVDLKVALSEVQDFYDKKKN